MSGRKYLAGFEKRLPSWQPASHKPKRVLKNKKNFKSINYNNLQQLQADDMFSKWRLCGRSLSHVRRMCKSSIWQVYLVSFGTKCDMSLVNLKNKMNAVGISFWLLIVSKLTAILLRERRVCEFSRWGTAVPTKDRHILWTPPHDLHSLALEHGVRGRGRPGECHR